MSQERDPAEPPHEPPILKFFAGVGLGMAALLLAGSVALVAFAQVLPAVFVFFLALGLGAFSLAGFYGSTGESDDQRERPQVVEESASGGEESPEDRSDTGEERSDAGKVLWLLSFPLAAMFIYAGLQQLGGAEFIVRRYEAWGYPWELRWAVGIVDLIGGVWLVIPRLARFGALLLTPIALGAVYTFLARGQPILVLVPLAALGLLAFVAWKGSREGPHLHAQH